ncbi:hypothetical protein [Rhodocyclus gracilis]|uniref:Uncharacterized protein n=1 Tax=Rhodocyclus tenuis TaxID=1066 RepID=A0A6L5K0V7_RHOTE|nr:hypothetical protein [Rhodocyclus gracilis]MQY52534.1 hypothetical protein [Rhodocyclus gracilis]
MSGPRIRSLVPDYKLLIYHLWATAAEDCGAWLLPLDAVAAETNLSAIAVADAIKEFEKRELIAFDDETGEVFICDWYRWHKFDSAMRQSMLRRSIARIRSLRLTRLVKKAAAFVDESYACKTKQKKQKETKEKENKRVADDAAASAFRCSTLFGAELSRVLELASGTANADRHRDNAALAEARALAEKLNLADDEAARAVESCRYPSELATALTDAAAKKRRKASMSRLIDARSQRPRLDPSAVRDGATVLGPHPKTGNWPMAT